MSESAISMGHELVKIAEDYERNEEWHKAIEAHNEAAVCFGQAIMNGQNNQIRKNLELLSENHFKIANDIRKRLIQMDKNKDKFNMNALERELQGIQQPYGHFSLNTIEDEDIEDPFNKFWGVVEPMMNRLSNPVPLSHATSINYDTKENEEETDRIQREMLSISESFFVSPKDKEVKIDTQNIVKSPKEENNELKQQIATIQEQIKELEKKSIDSTLLKSSIIQFKNDVQAIRTLQTQENSMMTRSATTTASMISKNVRHVGSSTAEIVNQIKKYEDLNRSLKSQNKKQKALIDKYKERWEKLKESANKRQPSSTNYPLLNSLRASRDEIN